jgi:chromosome transmission fidelity protein 4
VPLLDTNLLPRLASGRRQENYFPIAVADNKFHCIILKGGDQYPYFPRPLLSEFDFSIPLTSAPAEKAAKKPKPKKIRSDDDDLTLADPDSPSASEAEPDDDDEPDETTKLTQSFLLKSLQAAQLADQLSSASRKQAHGRRAALARAELEVDKTLLQMLAVECREGEERGMRALEIVGLMRDRTGRMVEAAGKVAERYGRAVLGEKIREVGERRVAGEGSESEDGGDDDFA